MFENIRLSFQGVWSHKMRSFLTMLSIIIGIAAIIAIVSIIQGSNEQIKKNLIGSGTNTVNVRLTEEGDYEHAVFVRSEKTTWGDYSDNGYARQNGDYSIYKDGMLYDSFNGIPDDIEFTMYYYKLPDGTMFYICTGLSENGSMPATDRHE